MNYLCKRLKNAFFFLCRLVEGYREEVDKATNQSTSEDDSFGNSKTNEQETANS
jgi:hypothetical protein